MKCFTCESVSNPRCADLSDNKVYQPQECVAEQFISQGSGFLSQLGLGGNSNNANKETLTPVCLKVVTRNGKFYLIEFEFDEIKQKTNNLSRYC